MIRAFVALALCLFLGSALAQPSNEEAAIQGLLDELSAAWNRGDAAGTVRHFQKDITFTMLDGSLFQGREEFERKLRGIFAGAFKGTTMVYKARRVKFLHPDVAIVDVETSLSGRDQAPPHSSLMLVVQKEGRDWLVAGFHNTAQRSLSSE